MTSDLSIPGRHPTAAQVLMPAVMTALIFGALPLANTLRQAIPEYTLHDLTLAPPPTPPPAAPPEPQTSVRDEAIPLPALEQQRLPIPVQASLMLSRDSQTAVGDFALSFEVLDAGLHSDPLDLIFEIAEVDRAPVPLVQQDPPYPPGARLRGIEGQVTLEFLVDTDGKVQRASVISATPASLFDRAALQAVHSWRFQPAMRQGQAVTVRVRQTLRFLMDQ